MAKNDRVSFDVKGGKDLQKQLKEAGPAVLKAAAKSLYRSCEEVMTESKERYVPIDTGALRSTGRVDFPVIEKNNVQASLGYGGPAAPYAIHVHEQNKNYKNGRQWKYLETPLFAAKEKMAQDLKDAINEALETL